MAQAFDALTHSYQEFTDLFVALVGYQREWAAQKDGPLTPDTMLARRQLLERRNGARATLAEMLAMASPLKALYPLGEQCLGSVGTFSRQLNRFSWNIATLHTLPPGFELTAEQWTLFFQAAEFTSYGPWDNKVLAGLCKDLPPGRDWSRRAVAYGNVLLKEWRKLIVPVFGYEAPLPRI